MLLIENTDQLSPVVTSLLKDLRRTHVSRFPVRIEVLNPSSVRFHDTRFPSGTLLASLYRDKDAWVVQSRLINQPRFNGARKHQKRTGDVKKVLRYLRDFAISFTPEEVANRTFHTYDNEVDAWKYSLRTAFIEAFATTQSDLIVEVERMVASGYVPRTPSFIRMYDKGIAAAKEWDRMKSRQIMKVSITINADDTVDMFSYDKLGYGGINRGLTVLPSLLAAPACVQEAVAMLRLVDEGKLVPEVGMRTRPNTFWVEVLAE
jgi:hypothetical protein